MNRNSTLHMRIDSMTSDQFTGVLNSLDFFAASSLEKKLTIQSEDEEIMNIDNKFRANSFDYENEKWNEEIKNNS